MFGTLHSRTGPQTIDRMINIFPEGAKSMIRVMLSESLKGVITQQLVRKASGHGRLPAVEMMKVNVAIANLIREGRTFQIQSQMQVMKRDGALTMDDALMALVEKRQVSYDSALGAAEDRDTFSRYFNRRSSATTRIVAKPEAEQNPQQQQPAQEKADKQSAQSATERRTSRFSSTRT